MLRRSRELRRSNSSLIEEAVNWYVVPRYAMKVAIPRIIACPDGVLNSPLTAARPLMLFRVLRPVSIPGWPRNAGAASNGRDDHGPGDDQWTHWVLLPRTRRTPAMAPRHESTATTGKIPSIK
jgi:hypothetical protein